MSYGLHKHFGHTQLHIKKKNLKLYFVWSIAEKNVVIVSGEQQRDSAIHIHISNLPHTPFPSRLSYKIDQSSMCYTVGPCWLSFFFLIFKYLFANLFILVEG